MGVVAGGGVGGGSKVFSEFWYGVYDCGVGGLGVYLGVGAVE